ncbi:L,D-transpeptidase, partial [uncultured Actinomyces sp.]
KYETEGVPWVTYFTGSYAMHGAPWRSSFGWSGYGGSHGCVNMPVDAAKFIYDWTDMGDTVVVHY